MTPRVACRLATSANDLEVRRGSVALAPGSGTIGPASSLCRLWIARGALSRCVTWLSTRAAQAITVGRSPVGRWRARWCLVIERDARRCWPDRDYRARAGPWRTHWPDRVGAGVEQLVRQGTGIPGQ